ncbi:hypothetical protein FRC14_005685 [Serendipita sp. 396]|nr:hypothetical protein FRC14_005685 [Serendipita sp. 396]KAG8780938.1 hypothetical protein FRC15_009139 [Serendipita sp. 397]KAG8797521.1 hypothetical protein FRC16_008784 [Serendipita sp. 398]KAG8865958.1 hypothetical protein FRC20_009228 [Serendipita sp. 405]KAG9058557.1 hypothetical protein FS842_007979 [Serendipita sp. 407]
MSRNQASGSNPRREYNRIRPENPTVLGCNGGATQVRNGIYNEDRSDRLLTRQRSGVRQADPTNRSRRSQLNHDGSLFVDSNSPRLSPVAGEASTSRVSALNGVPQYNQPSNSYALAPTGFYHGGVDPTLFDDCSRHSELQEDETVASHRGAHAARVDSALTQNPSPPQVPNSFLHGHAYNLGLRLIPRQEHLPNHTTIPEEGHIPPSFIYPRYPHTIYEPGLFPMPLWNDPQSEQAGSQRIVVPSTSSPNTQDPAAGPSTSGGQLQPIHNTNENNTQRGRKYCCSKCQKSYPKRSRLEACENRHKERRPYVCNGGCGNQECNKAFYGSECLSKHKSETRYITCELCGKLGYRRNSKRHQKSCRQRLHQ